MTHDAEKTSKGNYRCVNCGKYATSKAALGKTKCSPLNLGPESE